MMFCPLCGECEEPIHLTSSEWKCPNCNAVSTPFEWFNTTNDVENDDDAGNDEPYDADDDFDEQLSNCGMTEGGCMLAGTEYCDWECRIGKYYGPDEDEQLDVPTDADMYPLEWGNIDPLTDIPF